jgi:hypothetical protein
MFAKNSRYKDLPTVSVTTEDGDIVPAVKLRMLGQPLSRPAMITQGDQLDVLAQRQYQGATRYWHLADANTELEANSLTGEPGSVIQAPVQE